MFISILSNIQFRNNSLVKTLAKFVKILEQVKILDLLSSCRKHSSRFSQGYKGTENIFYFLIITNISILVVLLLMNLER